MPYARRSTSGLAAPAPAALPLHPWAPPAACRATRARIPARLPATPVPVPAPAHPPARLPLRPHRLRAAAAISIVTPRYVGPLQPGFMLAGSLRVID